MKKCYIDKIQDSTKEIDYVFRGKGRIEIYSNFPHDRKNTL